jgi:hypothetical protein
VEAAKDLQNLVQHLKEQPQAAVAQKYLAALQRLHLEKDYKYKIDSAFRLDQTQKLVQPQSLFNFNNDQVLLFDSGLKIVIFYDLKGKVITSQDITEPVYKIGVDKDGNLLPLDTEGNLNLEGSPVQLAFSVEENTYPIANALFILTDNNKNIYVVTKKGDHIFKFDSYGTLITRVSKKEFDGITSFQIDNLDRLFIKDDSFDGVIIMSQNGVDIGSLSPTNPNYTFDDPAILKFDSFNNLFIYDQGLSAFLIFDSKQRFIKKISIMPPIQTVTDFIVTDSAEIYILDEDSKTIYKMY